jgi:hypothetical protein
VTFAKNTVVNYIYINVKNVMFKCAKDVQKTQFANLSDVTIYTLKENCANNIYVLNVAQVMNPIYVNFMEILVIIKKMKQLFYTNETHVKMNIFSIKDICTLISEKLNYHREWHVFLQINTTCYKVFKEYQSNLKNATKFPMLWYMDYSRKGNGPVTAYWCNTCQKLQIEGDKDLLQYHTNWCKICKQTYCRFHIYKCEKCTIELCHKCADQISRKFTKCNRRVLGGPCDICVCSKCWQNDEPYECQFFKDHHE